MNLLKNAYKYSINRTAKIVLSPGNTQLVIHIDNEGDQVSALEAEKLMIPFFRGANAHGKKGFGLGLSIIHRIITIHGGEILYKTQTENMNRFTITIPTQG
jgi:K+-sensing histidine kinase KdpD